MTAFKIRSLLQQSGLVAAAEQAVQVHHGHEAPETAEKSRLESDVEWLLIGKATIQVRVHYTRLAGPPQLGMWMPVVKTPSQHSDTCGRSLHEHMRWMISLVDL